MRLLYTTLFYLIQPFVWIRLLWRSRAAAAYRKRGLERYGFFKQKIEPHGILLHAVSVGESIAAVPLIRALQHSYPELPITVTTTTPTGSERILSIFGDSVHHVYLPYDLPGAVNRFLKRVNPKMIIIMETEIWPNLIAQLAKQKIPLIIANARLSERSAKGYAKLGKFIQSTLHRITLIAAQSMEDSLNFQKIGAFPSQIKVIGSLKFDISVTPELAAKAAAFRHQWATNRLVWIAASTHNGEEQQILTAHQQLLRRFPTLLLILVPRHPERFQEVAMLSRKMQFKTLLKSSGSSPTPQTEVVIGDTMGELMLLYGIADLAFVGGSLIERGGHNPLEPVAHKIPVLMGPHTFNFKEICYKLEQANSLLRVTDTPSLVERVTTFLEDDELRKKTGRNAANVLYQNQGALENLLKLIEPYLSR